MDAVSSFIGHYGLFAVFLGCMAEGESVAIVAGFFAHQGVLGLAPTFAVAAVGAFLGDAVLFAVGRYSSNWAWVQRLRAKPGFSHALDLARARPRLFVFFNRYVYGMRFIGGVAAGLAGIPWPTLVVWNALSAFVWASAFLALGWFFGLGAEALLGNALHGHQRLVIGVAILVVVVLVGVVLARRFRRREAVLERSAKERP